MVIVKLEDKRLNNEEKPDDAPPLETEIEFWRVTGESWISTSISRLDELAKWMVTTAAGITVANSALIQVIQKVTVVTVTPSLFFSFAVLCFIASLFPRSFVIHPSMTDDMMDAYDSSYNRKLLWHKLGFSLFFIGLLFAGILTLVP